MTVPPSILRVRIRTSDRRLGLWIPLFIIWPLAVIIALTLLPLVLIAAFILWPKGLGRPLLLAGPLAWRMFCALRGLEVSVERPGQQVLVYIR